MYKHTCSPADRKRKVVLFGRTYVFALVCGARAREKEEGREGEKGRRKRGERRGGEGERGESVVREARVWCGVEGFVHRC